MLEHKFEARNLKFECDLFRYAEEYPAINGGDEFRISNFEFMF